MTGFALKRVSRSTAVNNTPALQSSLNEGFESDSGRGSFRFFHSQSFNLQILKTVFQVSAPENSGEAAETAAKIVDTLSE